MDQQHVLQRRAIYTVLQEWLDEEKMVEALLVFEEHHKGKPSIAIHEYLTRINHLFEQTMDTRQIRRRLMEVLVRRSSDLAPDPMPMLQRAQARSASEVFDLQPSADQMALHTLISELMRKASAGQRKQLHEQLVKQLAKRFVNGSYDLLAQYLISDNPQYLARFDDRALQDFFTVIYVACCEVLGPVMTDQWFGSAVFQIRQNNSAAGERLNRYL
ncbi:MAG: hypothetical protein VXY23_10145 [Pseudomonadota bacterium]|nr:hypothetical protein [Pseudomonadota bacterium]